ncbi:guanylate cyclase domain-containing protein [Haematococcus lacustris]|uniref:Guanylate cyclase domain-containing protein n=1 Tax=Haematococcus lacustris TaxID=44745 RepID=A0A6A0A8D6_HAELA|nr:guanylate cyclase domain-containing protein [Haematococcus lacustris]
MPVLMTTWLSGCKRPPPLSPVGGPAPARPHPADRGPAPVRLLLPAPLPGGLVGQVQQDSAAHLAPVGANRRRAERDGGQVGLLRQLGPMRPAGHQPGQTLGASQGWLIDPESLMQLMGTPAMIETLNIIKALHRLSSPFISTAQDCSLPVAQFVTDACFMTISYGTTFKYVSHVSHASRVGAARGNLGAALVPGSDWVLDRPSNSLVPCTPARCPYSTQYLQPNGSMMLVNHSPGFEATLATINAQSAPELRFFSYSVLSYVSASTTH